ncbi:MULTISPECIES: hypothetical protein [Haloferacaceae]|uniref:MarR family transcriptional regulator n=1 Tax=Halorubrum glutamatedens TaxID=2707018 RepID=A0ABD5QU14_9EURY|nr:hypothetical protein [Halobellus captivus]
MDYEPDETEQAVLDVVRQEGRVNPMRVREQTEIRKQYVNDALRQLQKAGVIRKVNRGLYEHVPENDDEYGDAADQDVAALEERVAELEAQLESAREWLDVAVEAIDRGDPEELKKNTLAALAALEGEDD